MNRRHTIAFALISWYLMLPAQPPNARGTAHADTSPDAGSTWAVYKTQKACEQNRRLYLDDPVVGTKMAIAQCLPTQPDHTRPEEKQP